MNQLFAFNRNLLNEQNACYNTQYVCIIKALAKSPNPNRTLYQRAYEMNCTSQRWHALLSYGSSNTVQSHSKHLFMRFNFNELGWIGLGWAGWSRFGGLLVSATSISEKKCQQTTGVCFVAEWKKASHIHNPLSGSGCH